MGLYLICTSARTGGNVLCSTLAQTGILGRPGSYVYAYSANEILNNLNGDEFEKYLIKVPGRLYQEQNNAAINTNDLAWLYETNLLENLGEPVERLRYFYKHLKAPNMLEYLKNIRNSVLGGENWGIKILAYDSIGKGFDFFIQQLNQAQPNTHKKSVSQLLQQIGEVKYIWLTRRNKIRQALSRWKAIHTKKWHQKEKKVVEEHVDNKLPTMEALNKYVVQLTLDEAYWQEFFTKNLVTPLTIVYEDFIQNPEQTIKNVLNYLGIKPDKRTYFNGFSECKMANANSDNFINAYYDNAYIWRHQSSEKEHQFKYPRFPIWLMQK